MKEIKLLALEIKNFKGCKSLTLEPNGKDLNVYGQNETGKSTIADAWNWLLFDKDRLDQSSQKFDIKPLDEDNEPIHGLETEVKTTLEVNDSQLTLKKIYYEKWTKKRGSSEKIFDGHTTDYYISGVPVKKNEFENKIAELADENIFRLLTDPLYFNSQLHWKERREILLDVCDGISTEEVIEENNKLDELSDVLGERKIDDHKSVLKNQMNELNKDIQKIPVRIDEVSQGLPDVAGLDWKEIEPEIEELKEKKQKKEQELARAENGGEIAEKKKKITEIETELQEIRNEHTAEYEEQIGIAKADLSKARDELEKLERNIKNRERDIEEFKKEIEKLEKEKEQLKQEWYDVQAEKEELIAEEFPEEENDTCPTCHRPLPGAQIEEARANYNQEKAQRIEQMAEEQKEINNQGKSIVSKITQLNEETEQLQNEIDQLKHDVSFKEDEIEKLEKDIEELQEKAGAYQGSNEYQEKLKEKYQLKEGIEQLQGNNVFSLQKIDKEITSISEKIEEKQEKLNDIKVYNKGQERIKELKAEERKLAKKYEELEREMYLCEQYEKTRAELLEEKVNGRFKLANFKLFEKQINGGIKPTCRTTYKGIPYNTNLNDGHKVHVGLDIIDTLSRHYGFKAPVFVDNSESISGEIKTNNQLIRLIVSEDDDKLRIEETS